MITVSLPRLKKLIVMVVASLYPHPNQSPTPIIQLQDHILLPRVLLKATT